MYNGQNRRIHDETEAKVTELDRRSGVRSSLEIIGTATIRPEAFSNGIPDSKLVTPSGKPKAPFGRDRDKIRIYGDIIAPVGVGWDAESNPDQVLNP